MMESRVWMQDVEGCDSGMLRKFRCLGRSANASILITCIALRIFSWNTSTFFPSNAGNLSYLSRVDYHLR